MTDRELHAYTVKHSKHLQGECDIRRTDWPYECAAKDKNPTDHVFTCVTHGAWWHEPAECPAASDLFAPCLCGAEANAAANR